MWGEGAVAGLGPGVGRDTYSFSFDSDDAAVETAEEAKEPAEADITELCRDMFSKMATYLTGELTGEAGCGLIRVLPCATRWSCSWALGAVRCFSSISLWLPPQHSPCPEMCLLEVWEGYEWERRRSIPSLEKFTS